MQCLVQGSCGLIGQQRGQKQLACAKSQFRNQKQHSSKIHSVSGSRVQGWQPPQQDQQLPPPRAVAALEAPAVDLETKQQQQQQQQQQQLEGAAPNLLRDNAYLRRNSKERLRMIRELNLHKPAAPADRGSSCNVWVVVPDFTLEPTNFELATADQVETATDASTSLAHQKFVLPKGWTAAAAPTAMADYVAAAATTVEASNATTTYHLNTSSSTSSSSSSSWDSWTRFFDLAIGTAVDSEAAAIAITAAADSAVAIAAAANVASLESSWLWEQERQPLQLPKVPMVRIELAQSPDGCEPGHFYMPDPLSSPCFVVESGQQQQQVLHQANDMQLAAALWKQAGKAAVMDTYPEEDGVLLLGYEENGVLLLDDEDQQRQTTELRQQAAATTAPESTGLTEAVVAADALRPSSSSSSNIDGEADAAAAAAAEQQQQPAQQLPQQDVQPEMATVEFCFRCVTKPGEQLWLVGDGDALGNWDPAKAVTMQWSEGHIWSVSLPFEQGTTVTYKALLQLAHQEPQHWRWQTGPNGLVKASRSSSSDDDEKPMKVEHVFK